MTNYRPISLLTVFSKLQKAVGWVAQSV